MSQSVLALQDLVCLEGLRLFYSCEHSFAAVTVPLVCVRSGQSSKTWPWLALEPNTKQEPPVNDSGKDRKPESHKVGRDWLFHRKGGQGADSAERNC